jgi:hypothetical protein
MSSASLEKKEIFIMSHDASYDAARIVVRSTLMSLDHMLMNAAMRRDFNEVVAVRTVSNALYDKIGDIKNIHDAEKVMADFRRQAGDLAKKTDASLSPVYTEMDALFSAQLATLDLAHDYSDQIIMDESGDRTADDDHAANNDGSLAAASHEAANSGLDLVVRQAALRVASPRELDDVMGWVDEARQAIAMEYFSLADKKNLTPDEARGSMLIAMGIPTEKKLVDKPVPSFVEAVGISNLIPRGFECRQRAYQNMAQDQSLTNTAPRTNNLMS